MGVRGSELNGEGGKGVESGDFTFSGRLAGNRSQKIGKAVDSGGEDGAQRKFSLTLLTENL